MLFPWIEEGFQKINELISSKIIESEHSGLGFLRTLTLMRRVFLQDAAAFYLDSPFKKCAVFDLDLFKTEEFRLFQKKVKDALSDTSLDMIFDSGTERKLNQVLESQLEAESRDLKILEKIDSLKETVGKDMVKLMPRIKPKSNATTTQKSISRSCGFV